MTHTHTHKSVDLRSRHGIGAGLGQWNYDCVNDSNSVVYPCHRMQIYCFYNYSDRCDIQNDDFLCVHPTDCVGLLIFLFCFVFCFIFFSGLLFSNEKKNKKKQ